MKFTFVIPDMSWLYDYKAQFSLGIMYIAEILRQENWEISLFDSNISPIETIPYSDIYGFSVVYNTYQSSLKLAQKIRQKYPQNKIIIGGVHATLDKNNIDNIFDSIFVGEAEDTFRDFIEDFNKKINKKYYIAKKPVDINKYYPYRSFLPVEYIKTESIFSNKEIYGKGSTSIMFSRGCPYSCAFCASPKIYNKRVRFRSIESIKKEIEQLINHYGIKQFRVQDDTFTLNKSFLRNLCKEICDLNIYYRCSTRVNHITDESIKYLYDSGCREIGIGIEAADNIVLQKLKKGITVEQAEKAIICIKRYPIILRCFFMIGTPFDSYDLMHKNIDFIEKNKIDNAVFANFIPFPGTAIYEEKEKYNIKSIKEKTCMNFARHLDLAPNILTSIMSEQEHIKIMHIIYDYLIKKNWIH